MDSRERVIRAVEMRKPDRVPILHEYLPAAMFRHGQRLVDLLARYPNDFGSSQHSIPTVNDISAPYRAGRNYDQWGTLWRSTANGIHGQVVDYPIHNWKDAEEYEFPPLPDDAHISRRKKEVREAKKSIFVRAGFNPGNYFERLQWLMGFKTVLTNLVRRPPEFLEFADRLLEYCLDSISRTLETEPDCVGFADDWGSQDRLLIRPELWREFFKPRYRRMFDLVHDGGAFVHFHSDGYIMDILDDLSEIGVNILNPQFSCHNLEELAAGTRGKFCINSDVDRQVVLPHYPPDRVKAHIQYLIDLFGRGNNGGLIGRGELNMDVPLENIEAMFDGWIEFGTYRWDEPES